MDQATLMANCSYNPETGIFTGKSGKEIGHYYKKGYVKIWILGKRYFAHRMAWLYVHGYLPDEDIDHENLTKDDNRIDNLRPLSSAKNLRYRRGLPNKAVKAKGVRLTRHGRFNARIEAGGSRKILGTFSTADEAAHAYNKAAIELFGELAVLNPIGADK